MTSARAARIFSSMEMKVPEAVRPAPSSKKATASKQRVWQLLLPPKPPIELMSQRAQARESKELLRESINNRRRRASSARGSCFCHRSRPSRQTRESNELLRESSIKATAVKQRAG